jgi:thioredoxin 1
MKLKNSLALCVALLASSWTCALTVAPYSPEAFAKLQAADARAVLHFHADWCPTCRAQDKALEVLKADPALDVTVLSVDYDKETELKRQLNVRSQSTFIVYRGKVERSRQIGETSPEGIRKVLRSSL